MVDDPFVLMLSIAESDNTKAWRYIRSVLNGGNFVEAELQRLSMNRALRPVHIDPPTLI